MKKTRICVYLLLISLLFLPAGAARGQGLVEVVRQEVDFTFGEEIVFQVEFISEEIIEGITISIHPPGLPTFVGAVTQGAAGLGTFVYSAADRPLPAFTSIRYSYQFTLRSGEIVSSPEYEFTYLDNRFNWQELDQAPFKIFWYQGEINLAQEVLDAALQGQSRTLDLLQQPPDSRSIVIFIYGSENDLLSSLTLVGESWIGGHADPTRDSIVVALPPAVDQPLEIQRLIPHEVAHILLARFMGAEYAYLPAWLSEGIASQMEIYSLPDYGLAVERAYQEGDLIPFQHLCQTFPADGELALLAYAQADAFVDYIRAQHGVSGLQSLIYAYDQGVSCERGVEISLGTTLASLERDWLRDTFSRDSILTMIYILAGLLIVMVIGLGWFISLKIREKRAGGDWDEDEYL